MPGAYGPGEASYRAFSPDGAEDWMIYHATPRPDDGWKNRYAHIQRFTWNPDGTPNFGKPIIGARLPLPSGEAQARTVGDSAVSLSRNFGGGFDALRAFDPDALTGSPLRLQHTPAYRFDTSFRQLNQVMTLNRR